MRGLVDSADNGSGMFSRPEFVLQYLLGEKGRVGYTLGPTWNPHLEPATWSPFLGARSLEPVLYPYLRKFNGFKIETVDRSNKHSWPGLFGARVRESCFRARD